MSMPVSLKGAGAGRSGTAQGGIFVTGVTPNASGTVVETFVPSTDPANKVVDSIDTDTTSVDVTIEVDGSEGGWQPDVTVNGQSVTLSQLATDVRRWTGTATAVDPTGGITATNVTDENEWVVSVTLHGAGPTILTFAIGSYPGSQTELKAGDTVVVSGTTDGGTGDSVKLNAYGAFDASGWQSIAADGSFSFTATVSSNSGTLNGQAVAKNDFGTEGANKLSDDTAVLNQTYPSFTFTSIDYPATQAALKASESATVNLQVDDFDTVLYSSPNGDLTIPSPSVYDANKVVTRAAGSYNDSVDNFRCVATRAANDASTTYNDVVEIANVAPTVQVSEPAARLRSSASGEDYTVTLTSDQSLGATPTLDAVAGAGTFGAFTGGPKTWTATLNVDDADTKGTHAWSNLVATNKAGLTQNSITGDANYVLGGFTGRNCTFPAFSHLAPIGTDVEDTAKLSAVDLGAQTLTYRADKTATSWQYTIVDSGGNLDPNGNYMWLCDQDLVDQNGTGTYYITLEETV